MAAPVVVIVGRPNVGKSSLFNWLAGRRISIVDATAGVTRDRVTAPVEVAEGKFAELVDTGGMGLGDADALTAEVEAQIQVAIDQADVILFVVDARDGVVPLDEEVARRLRAVGKPTVCVANKCDTPGLDAQAAEFYRLGFSPVVPVSAEQKRGREALLAEVAKRLPARRAEAPPEAEMKMAIVGRRNAGKSTFINSLAEDERVIVSEVPGTTRDSIDVRFERDGKTFIAIDTAGVRRKKSIASDVEWYGMARAERSIRRADVVLHFLDARLRISKVDKQLAEYIIAHHKPAIFVVNKWDLMADKMATEQFARYIHATFPMLDYVPIAFITAKSGRNVQRLLNLAQHLVKQSKRRVHTGDLNRVLREAMAAQAPPVRFNRQPKIYYATQVGVQPPTIVLFTNGPELFDEPYLRYLTKAFRRHLRFPEVPIKLVLRDKHGGPGREDASGMEETVLEQPLAEELTAAPTPAPEPKRRKREAQLPGSSFKTTVSEEEYEREQKKL
ncbi:MAG TPA: ribosome biogenesis GTPase Der, partial [Gemmataceae bacterium]